MYEVGLHPCVSEDRLHKSGLISGPFSRRPHWSLGMLSPLQYICSKLTAEESQMLWTDTEG